jgi:cytidylate kinase
MIMTNNSLSAFSGYIGAQARLQRAGQFGQIRPAITISRQCGSGSTPIANAIATKFNALRRRNQPIEPWLIFDRNLAEHVLAEHKLAARVANFMPEDATSNIQAAFEEFLGLHPSNWTLVQYTNETILRLAQTGNVIIVGRGANFVTAHLPNVFHVRLVAPEAFRAAQMKGLLRIDEKAVLAHIQKTDRARRRYLRRNFHSDIDDPIGYHLIINTDRVSVESAADLILQGALIQVEGLKGL